MIEINLKSLSNEINMSIEEIIKHFSEIGILKNKNNSISQLEKNLLFKHLRNIKKFSENTFVFQRKTRSTLNMSTIGGKSKSIQVEVRKKRTYIKNNKSDLRSMAKHQTSVQKKEKIILNSFKKITPKEKVLKKNYENILEKKPNKSSLNLNKINLLKRFSTINKKTAQENTEISISNKENNKSYNSTFLRTYENIKNNHETENHKKNYTRGIKNYRQKKYGKQNNNIKNKKDEIRVTKNKKNIRQKNKSTLLRQAFQKPASTVNRDIIINDTISVSELSNKMAIKSSEVIKVMMNMGIMATINYILDQETAQLIAEEMGHKVFLRKENALEELIMKDRDTGNNIPVIRAPVVTIMGHVDHGKTSLLDYIRSTKVAFHEAGGITQNIGAYHVISELGSITFLDTPGHSAFTKMRARGAEITDIVVLVVAIDDGIKPQTVEAIQHAQAANVPIIVAINKVDKVGFDINQIKNDLTKYNIVSEEWGGENIFVPVSAKTGEGTDELLNAILLQSEILELKSISTGMAEGVVIESFLDKGRGPIATVLVQKGSLKKGDIILCGCEYGRVKALRNEIGELLNSAGPSIPVEVLGLSKVPLSGDKVTVVRDEKKAKEVAFYRKDKYREIKLANQNRSNLENMFENIKKSNFSELKVIIKSDVQGSLEAISGALLKLSTNEVKVKIIGLGIGGITETDASLALASNAIILGFNVRADSAAKKIINLERLDLRYYSVIYNLIDEVKSFMAGLLKPERKQNIIGLAEVRNIFKSPQFGLIAGSMVTEGIIKRNNPIHVLRNNVVMYEGELESLRRFKEDVSEVRNGMECGIGIKNYSDVRVGDIIEVFEVKEIKRIL
ncbi:translation initiation factor IF-2 [Buchnera aphidicola (Melanaphis sacchari)]|uniref:Translation initiation factor IF-2 n=1 Tax=Buchnera aphidicola (Melanaphis sacchari) TaxID=2173854 RepID=A0A2U8DF32_9GAMM|nr:translation initiation factor IF-2 [Buchnera aphidicola]AWH90418.1 translation initiation factor IF-2 [Buchnera aphidicola (Melanaphis sacchari)]